MITIFEYQQGIDILTRKYFFGEITSEEYMKGMNELSSKYYKVIPRSEERQLWKDKYGEKDDI
jgi:hypothetical protein